MNELVEFVLTQIKADEAAARAAHEAVGDAEWIGSHGSGHPWRYVELGSGVYAYNEGIASGAELVAECSAEKQSHIARHDPARVLADCAAKRARVAYLAEAAAKCPPDDWPDEGGMDLAALSDQARYLLLLEVQPYADRPGFDPAWKVET